MNTRIPPARTASRHHPADRTPPDDPADQPLMATALTAPTPITSYKRITDRSFCIQSKLPKAFRSEYHENIPDIATAQKVIADFEAMPALQTTGINITERNTRLSDKMSIRGYLPWLISIIHCYLICNALDKAEEYINFVIDALDNASDQSFPDKLKGDIYYLKFQLLLHKRKRAMLQQKLQASALPEATLHALEQEMRCCLEIAIRYGNFVAIMAGIVYNLDLPGSIFPPDVKRAFALVDKVYHDTKKKIKEPVASEGTNNVLVTLFSMILESIGIARQEQSARKDWSNPENQITHLLCQHTHYQNRLFMKTGSYFNFLAQRKDDKDKLQGYLYYIFLGDRELLFRYLQCHQAIILYILQKEDIEQFTTCITQLETLVPEHGFLCTRFLAKILEYRECTWVYGYPDKKTRPACDTDLCQFDPLLHRETLDYIQITHLASCQKWLSLEEYFNRVIRRTDGNLPFSGRLFYLDLLIKRGNLPEALVETVGLVNEYMAMGMYDEAAIMTFKTEELETLVYADTSSARELKRLVSPRNEEESEILKPEEQSARQEDVEELANALEEEHFSAEPSTVSENHSTTMAKADRTPIPEGALFSLHDPVVPPPSASRKTHTRRTTAPVQDYNYFIHKIRSEMESCSLHGINQTIDQAFKIPTLTILERGRLWWQKGWAYTALAANREIKKLALSFFNKALACAVRKHLKEKQDKQKSSEKQKFSSSIDMPGFLNDAILAECIYEGSYLVPGISLIADVYSGAGHCQRDLGNADLGRRYSDLADRIKPWRRKRIHRYSNVVEPKLKIIPRKPLIDE